MIKIVSEKEDPIGTEGVVTEALPNAQFRVKIGVTDKLAICTLSGKMRQNNIKVLVGDKVMIELSPYDLGRGRITYRMRGM